MPLIAWVPQIRLAHETLVACSGALFALRGAAVLVARPWPLRRSWRALSVAIDTLLLGAGVTLWVLLQLDPLRSPWLGTKLVLLVPYVVLGNFALRGRTPALRSVCYAAALATFAYMVTVAVAHDPRGLLAWW
jgi:uncharacterized membrane protein SirB2